jgi:hypothetical protein
MPYAKLDSCIISSSIWSEANGTRLVWITMLAMKDDLGFVSASHKGLARMANVSIEETEEALKVLSSPDPDSRTKDNEGRRVSEVEGGWIVLNHDKYRLPEQEKRDNHRVYVANQRKIHKQSHVITVNHNESQPITDVSLPVSVSVSSSESELNAINDEPIKETSFDHFWKQYPKKEGKGAAAKAWAKMPAPSETLKLIEAALEWQKKTEKWTKSNGQFIPMPTTYLNGQCWLDEPTGTNGKPTINLELFS